MELATIFLIWLAITIIENLAKRKKSRIQQPSDSPNFDTPTIQGDPNFPSEEVPIFIQSPQQAEVRPRNLTPPKKKISAQEVQEAEETDELNLNLTPSNVLNAFVLSEVLDKPKALRRRRF